MLDEIKRRLGIDSAVMVYDSELESLIAAAAADMKAAGVPADLLEADPSDDRALLCITSFVRGHYGEDRSDTNRYLQIFREMTFRLCQEEGGS